MSVGTRSILFGVHAFWLHWFFVARAWKRLYGFPSDPRLWVAFFVHDLGYAGKPNMDGPEGEQHPIFGAFVMELLFGREWGDFCRYHSRYLAKKEGKPYSRLCVADKLAIVVTPDWLYLPMATLSGEIKEYLKNAQKSDSAHWKPTGYDKKVWRSQLKKYMMDWVAEHSDGRADTWTSSDRHAKNDAGVYGGKS